MKKLPPPVGEPRFLPAGSIATPKSNFAFVRMFVRLPVVVQIIATFFSMKSFGVVPHSTTPAGCTPCLRDRSTQNCNASMTFGSS